MTRSTPFEDPATVAKRNALRSATERLQTRLHEFFSGATKEIDDFMLRNSELEEKARYLDLEKNRMEQERMQNEMDVDSLSKNFDELSVWLASNDGNAKIDIDAITEPKDALSKQLLWLVAEDATIEDTLYYLEKKMNNRELPLDAFLKYVRSLAAEQFTKRATIKKIQMEKQRKG